MVAQIQALSSVASTVPPKDAFRGVLLTRRGAPRRTGPHFDKEPEFLVWSTLASVLSLSKEVKKSTMAESSFRCLDWSQCSQEGRDAILAALTVLP